MSGTDDPDILAGEYALGLLDEGAARSVAARAAGDPVLAAAIARWQNRLCAMADMTAPVPPRDAVWRRIDAATRPGRAAPPAPPPQRNSAWPALALASMAVAACLALFIWANVPRAPDRPWAKATALLSVPGDAMAMLRAQVTSSGMITIVPLRHITVPEGRKLGFWAWPQGRPAPLLLGMIKPDGGQLRFPFAAREGMPVMVTLENQDRTGTAPGPTLYLGLLVTPG